MLASLSRCPCYQQITEKPRLDFMKQAHVLLTCHAVLDVMNKQFIVCKHVLDSLAVKKKQDSARETTDNDVT